MFSYFPHYCDQISDQEHPKGVGGDHGSMGTMGSKGTQSVPVRKAQCQEQGASMTHSQEGAECSACRVAPPTFGVGLPTPGHLRWRLSHRQGQRVEGCLFCDYGSCDAGSTSTLNTLLPEGSRSSCSTFPAAFGIAICEFSQNVHFMQS